MQNQLVDFYRSGIKTAADVTRLSLENSIRLQEKQLEIVRGLFEEQSRSADEIARAGSIQELLAVQSLLANAQMGRWAELWTNMWQAVAQTHAQGLRSSEDVARSAASQVSRAVGSVEESAEAANQEQRKHQRKSA